MTLDPNRLGPRDRLLVGQIAGAIELNAGRGAILVLAAPFGKRDACAQALLEALPGYREHLVPPGADVLPPLIRAGPNDKTLYSVPFYALDASALKGLLQSLNYRRELIAEHGIALLLWLEEADLDALPHYAKDFWSFRTGTYRFDPPITISRGEMPALDQKHAEIADTERLLREAQRSGGTPAELAPIYIRLGRLHYQISELGPALDALKLAEKAYAQTGDPRNRAVALGNIGVIYQHQGDLDAALKTHKEALSIHRQIGHQQGAAHSLGNIGIIYRHQGDPDAALKTHEEALAIHRQIGHQEGVAAGLSNIGLVYQGRGDLETALKAHEDALAISRQIGHQQGVASQLTNIGIIYQHRGDLKDALKAYEEALAISRQIGDQEGVGNRAHQCRHHLSRLGRSPGRAQGL